MLQRLLIKNMALIESIEVEFGQGMNVLTGETGAGKSVLIDALTACLGGKAGKEIIRAGHDRAVMEAVFDVSADFAAQLLEMHGIDAEEGLLVLSREVMDTGRTGCRINGRTVTVSLLREVGSGLVDVHGQHDNQALLDEKNHLGMLDAFVREALEPHRQKYLAMYHQRRQISQEIRSLSGDRRERERYLDLLRFQVEEIRQAKPRLGEEEQLTERRLSLAGSEKISSGLSKAYGLLNGQGKNSHVSGMLVQATSELQQIGRISETAAALAARLESVQYEVSDIVDEIHKALDLVEEDPRELEKCEARLDVYARLRRKYGQSTEEILAFYKKAAKELEDLENAEERVSELVKMQTEIEARMTLAAAEMHNIRESGAKNLTGMIEQELHDLEMKYARFHVQIDWLGDTEEPVFNEHGLSRAAFLMSANPGEPLRSLGKVASGGELARIMLAVKSILADSDAVATQVFDEVDTGISGKTSQKVGEKLAALAKKRQTLCITHHAVMAAMADHHLLISKESDGIRTRTSVRALNFEQRAEEIARILAGDPVTKTTLQHAQELLDRANALKDARERRHEN